MATFSADAIKQGNAEAGQYYFSENTMRFFRSRVMSRVFPVPDGAVFVTSERREGCPRLYTLRRYHESDGTVSTLEGFQDYRTYNGSMKAAKRAADVIRARS